MFVSLYFKLNIFNNFSFNFHSVENSEYHFEHISSSLNAAARTSDSSGNDYIFPTKTSLRYYFSGRSFAQGNFVEVTFLDKKGNINIKKKRSIFINI